jgi:hypothetical protein
MSDIGVVRGKCYQKYQRIAASPHHLLMQRSQRRLPLRPTTIDRMVALAAVICPSFGRCAWLCRNTPRAQGWVRPPDARTTRDLDGINIFERGNFTP